MITQRKSLVQMDPPVETLRAGGEEWQIEVLKSENLNILFNVCKEQVKKYLIGDEMDREREAKELLRDNIEYQVLCNGGDPCDCCDGVDINSLYVNAIITWYNETKDMFELIQDTTRWQREIFKTRDIDLIHMICARQLASLNGGNLNEAFRDLKDRCTVFTTCNCGFGCDCFEKLQERDSAENQIVIWYDKVKKYLGQQSKEEDIPDPPKPRQKMRIKKISEDVYEAIENDDVYEL